MLRYFVLLVRDHRPEAVLRGMSFRGTPELLGIPPSLTCERGGYGAAEGVSGISFREIR